MHQLEGILYNSDNKQDPHEVIAGQTQYNKRPDAGRDQMSLKSKVPQNTSTHSILQPLDEAQTPINDVTRISLTNLETQPLEESKEVGKNRKHLGLNKKLLPNKPSLHQTHIERSVTPLRIEELESQKFLNAQFTSSALSSAQKLDISFLHADCMMSTEPSSGIAEDLHSLSDDNIQESMKMYKTVLDVAARQKRRLMLTRNSLNIESLKDAIQVGPKILFLKCQNGYDQIEKDGSVPKNSKYFFFEDQKIPTLLDKYNYQQLQDQIKGGVFQVQLIMISSNQASCLAEMIHKMGFPVVVGLPLQTQESPSCLSKIFIDSFLEQLLCGLSPKHAFSTALQQFEGSNTSPTRQHCCCEHEHDPHYCLWYRFAKKEGFQVAHELHKTLQKCSCNSSRSSNLHAKECKVFRAYLQTLFQSNSKSDEEFFLKYKQLKGKDPNYLQSSQVKYEERGDISICCCKARDTVQHSQVKDFVLLGDEDMINVPIFNLSSRPVDQTNEQHQLPLADLSQWQNRDEQQINGKNFQINQLVERLISSKERKLMFLLDQTKGSDTSAIVDEAVLQLYYRGHPICKDGIVKVDISCATKHSIKHRIAYALRSQINLQLMPLREQIVSDLKLFSRLLVFTGAYRISDKVQREVLLQIASLSQQICSKFVIQISSPIEDALTNQLSLTLELEPDRNAQNLQIFKKELVQASKFDIIRQLHQKDKHWLLSSIDQCSIKVITKSVIDAKDFDNLASRLAQIKSEAQRSRPNSLSHTDHEVRELLGIEQIRQQLPTDEAGKLRFSRMLNTMLLLCQLPLGFCQSDLRIFISKLLVAETSGTQSGAPEKKVKFELPLKQDPSSNKATEDPSPVKRTVASIEGEFEKFLSSFSNSDSAYHGLVHVKPFIKTKENYYQPHFDNIEMLQSMLRLGAELATSLKQNSDSPQKLTHIKDRKPIQGAPPIPKQIVLSENQIFFKIIELCQQQARDVLLEASARRRQGPEEFEPQLVTAHLNVGMWSAPNLSYEAEKVEKGIDQIEKLTYPLERFDQYILGNIQMLFKSDWLEENICNLLLVESPSESKMEFGSKSELMKVRTLLFDLFICVPSILIELERPKEGEEIIVHIKKLLKKTEKNLPVWGAINLILASLSIHFSDVRSNVVASDAALNFIKKAFLIFRQAEEVSGARSEPQAFPVEEGLAEAYYLQSQLQFCTVKQKLTQMKRLYEGSSDARTQQQVLLQLELDFQNSIKNALQRFQALTSRNCQLGSAKTMLLGVRFYVECNSKIERFRALKDSGKMREQSFKWVEKANQCLLDIDNQRNRLYVTLLHAKLLYMEHDRLKHETSQCSERCLIKALTKVEQIAMQFNISHWIRSIPRTEIELAHPTKLRTLSAVKNLSLLNEVIKLKNLNLNTLVHQSKDSNHFVFAAANPLVQNDRNFKPGNIGNFTRHRAFEKERLLGELRETEMECFVSFEYLTEDFVMRICERGAKVLQFGAVQRRKDIVEAEAREELGMMGKWSFSFLLDWFQYALTQINAKELPIECIIITTPNVKAIQGIFSRLGVQNVISFITNSELNSEFDYFDYEKATSLFVRKFCKFLLKGNTVRGSFLLAQVQLNTISRKVRAMMRSSSKEQADNFVPQEPRPGYLVDCSYQAGIMQNLAIPMENTYLGQAEPMFKAVNLLAQRGSKAMRLLHIYGEPNSGMHAFTSHIANYLNSRGYFQYGILQTDFSLKSSRSSVFRQINIIDKISQKNHERIGKQPFLLILNWVDQLDKAQLTTLQQRLLTVLEKCPNVNIVFSTQSQDFTLLPCASLNYEKSRKATQKALERDQSLLTSNRTNSHEGVKLLEYKLELPLLSDEQARFFFNFSCHLHDTLERTEEELDQIIRSSEQSFLECSYKAPLIANLASKLMRTCDQDDQSKTEVQNQQKYDSDASISLSDADDDQDKFAAEGTTTKVRGRASFQRKKSVFEGDTKETASQLGIDAAEKKKARANAMMRKLTGKVLTNFSTQLEVTQKTQNQKTENQKTERPEKVLSVGKSQETNLMSLSSIQNFGQSETPGEDGEKLSVESEEPKQAEGEKELEVTRSGSSSIKMCSCILF